MKAKQIIAAAAAGVLALSAAMPAFAATTTPSIIDGSQTGSITIVKLKDNDARISLGNGIEQDVSGMHPMQGIEFSVVKVADIAAVSSNIETIAPAPAEPVVDAEGDEQGLPEASAEEPGEIPGQEFPDNAPTDQIEAPTVIASNEGAMVGTYFTNMDGEFAAMLEDNGIGIDAVYFDGIPYYTTESVSAALLDMNRLGGEVPGEVQLNGFARERGTHMEKTDENGTSVISSLPLGLYLVAETDYSEYVSQAADTATNAGSMEVVYNPSSPFFVSLPMTNQTEVNGMEAGTAWQYDVTVYPKNQTVNIPKYIVQEEDGNTLQQSEDFEIGEVVKQVIAPSAPAVEPTLVNAAGAKELDRKYEKYVIRDVMEDGLSLKSFPEEIEVKLGDKVVNPESLSQFDAFETLVYETDYTVSVSEDDQTFEVTFLDAGLEKLNARTADSQVVVIFESFVDRDMSPMAGEAEAVKNQPELTWKNANTSESTVRGNQPKVYSYRLEIQKNGLADSTKASFSAVRGGEKVSFVSEADGVYHLYDNTKDLEDEKLDVIHANSEGQVIIRGLDADVYTFTEKSTESGHELMKSKFDVALGGNIPSDGVLTSATTTVDGKTSDINISQTSKGTASFAIENHPSIILRTGGNGILVFCLAAAGMFVIAGGLMAVRKKVATHMQ